MFKTAYGERERHITPAGERIETRYGYNKKGELEATGTEDVYEKIQECAEETKIENILKRLTAGDTSVLRPDGIYEDVSMVPKDYNSQVAMIKEANEAVLKMQAATEEAAQAVAKLEDAAQAAPQQAEQKGEGEA